MRFRLRSLFLVAATVALAAGMAVPAQAQHLTPGTRIRVTSGDAYMTGFVKRSTPDSLVLSLRGGSHAGFAWADVGRVEQSLGRRGRPGRGALIGAGAMTALTVGSIVFGNAEDETADDIEDLVLIITLPVNAALGAGVGALIGLAVRTERWRVLPVGPAHAGDLVRPGLTAAIRF